MLRVSRAAGKRAAQQVRMVPALRGGEDWRRAESCYDIALCVNFGLPWPHAWPHMGLGPMHGPIWGSCERALGGAVVCAW